jgi:signal transduction histidine kinase
MALSNDNLFSSDLWEPALEKFGCASGLTVQLFGADTRAVLGPIHSTPLLQLFARFQYDPGIFSECARRCVAQAEIRPAVVVSQSYGLAVVGASLVLEGEVVGAAVGGYVLMDFCESLGIRRLSLAAGIPFERVWEVARKQQPVPERRLIVHGDLLQVLGDALLRENYRTRQYEHTAQRLEEAAAAKDEFIAVLSHELRTPLSPILGWTRILRRSNEPGPVSHAAEVIERNALLQLKLIEDLLNLNRVLRGKLALDLKVQDLASVLHAVLDTFSEDAEKKHVTLELIEAEQPLLVEGDTARLQQIFGNILSNAVKFTPEAGTIRVDLSREAEDARVEIRDPGEGIAPEFMPHVFEIFRQQEEGTRRRHAGLGIGLAVVKRLVDLHRGTVELSSDGVGRGTLVTVRLPLMDGGKANDGIPDSSDQLSASPICGLSILLVEDTDDTREAMRVLLETLGARVSLASDGREALSVIAGGNFDVVLCDLWMPVMDGFEFLRELRRDPDRDRLPVIAVSGLISEADHERTRTAGFAGHIDKPVEDAALFSSVQAVLGQNPTF